MTSITETDPDRSKRRYEVVRVRELPPIGPDAYEMLGEIARGGMGRIMRARDRRLGRTVAIKQLLDPTPRMIALFEREVRITARLQHPSIVSVLEAGVLPSGDPIYVMKLVPGRALRDVLRDSLAVRERLGLLPITIAIADALAYAHKQGVIHRDLKPSNVLVGEFGEVVVIDWGLAHDSDAGIDDTCNDAPIDTAVTARAMGTPAYMAPEAARGEAVDERADVYAIGAILYETLSGAAPYEGDDGAAILNAVRLGPPESIAIRAPGTPADLAAIVDKAMAHNRDARYPTARELAEELRRFATGQLVSAHVYSIRDRIWRWIRRNRGAVSVGVAATALVITLVTIGVTRIVHARDAAAEKAELLLLARARLELDRDPAAALSTLTDLPAASPLWSAARTIASDAVARGVPRHAQLLETADAIAIVGGRPRALVRHDDGFAIIDVGGAVIARVPGPAQVATLSADGQSIATIGDGRVRVWRIASKALDKPLFDNPGPRGSPVIALAGDGSAVAVAGRDVGIIAWRVGDGGEFARDAQARGVEHLAVSATGSVVFDTGGAVVRLRDGTPLTLRTGSVVGIALAGDAAITTTGNGEVRFADVDVPGGLTVGAVASALAVSPDDALVAVAGERGVTILDRHGRTVRAIPTRHRAHGVAIDAAGVVAISDGHEVWWWENAEPAQVHIDGPTAPVVAITAARDRLVAVAEDGSVWSWREGVGQRLGAHTAAARAVVIAPDNLHAITTGDDRTVRRWRLDGSGASEIIGVHQGPGLALAIFPSPGRPDELTLASGGADRIVRLWRGSTGGGVRGQHAGRVRSLVFSPSGLLLASIADDRIAKLWPLEGGAPRELVHDATVTAIAWLDDTTLVTGTRDGDVTLWSQAGRRVLCKHTGAVRSIAVAHASGRIASGGDDGQVAFGDTTTMELHAGHDDLVTRVVFAPDGATLASAGEDGIVRLWDPLTAESRPVALGQWVTDLAFTPDGATIAAAGAGGVWLIRDRLPHERGELRSAIAARVEAAR